MDVRGEMATALGTLIAIILVVSLGAIGLFGRMAPAIERILEENDYSLQAAEEMLAVLAVASTATDRDALRHRFDEALSNARNNVTEKAEVPELDAIGAGRNDALAGDTLAVQAVTESIQRLAYINRAAMLRVDREARRLGTAGAWSAVFLGLLGFGTGLIVFTRVNRRLLDPLVHVKAVLASAIGGDINRRCMISTASHDVAFVMRAVNELLDKYSPGNLPSSRDLDHCHASQTVLAWCLDRTEGARILVDGEGGIISANREALAALDGERGGILRNKLATRSAGDQPPGMRAIEDFPDADCVLYEIDTWR